MTRRDRAVAALLIAAMATELASLSFDWRWAAWIDTAVLLAILPVAAHRLGWREAYLLSLCVGLSALLLVIHPAPFEALRQAFDQAGLLMAFVLLLSLLQETAGTSRAIRETGMWLTRQPPGRRYIAIYSGTNVMSVLFNLGMVSLLAPLIKRGVEEAAPGDPLNPIRERRQLNALLRGFAWCVVWSPTAIAPLALMELIDGIDRGRWIAMGFVLALAVLAIGWAEDRLRFPPRLRVGATPVPPPWRAIGGFLAVCAVFLSLTGLMMAWSGGSVVLGLMLACPVLMAGWLWGQSPATAPARAREILGPRLVLSAPLGVTLACSGFVGRAAAALIPAEAWAEAIGLAAMPGTWFLTGLAVSVAVLSQFGLSPIMMAVFFGALLGALPSLPADPTLTALAISCGWALAMTSSPFATVVIMMDRATDHAGRELTWGWNLPFTGLCILFLAGVFWALAELF